MGNDYRPSRTRAIVDIDDLIIRADNIIIVGDRKRPVNGNGGNGRVAGVQNGPVFDDSELDDVEIRRGRYYQDDVMGISEEIHYYGSKRV